MDTRTKIVTAEAAAARAAGLRCTVYAATFDVLTADRIRRMFEIAEAGSLLVAVVTESGDSLLPAQARAELAASLAIIDLVVIADVLPGLIPGAKFVDDTAADRQRTAQLIRYIQQRNSGE